MPLNKEIKPNQKVVSLIAAKVSFLATEDKNIA